MLEVKGKYTIAKIMIDNVEESCLNQIYSMVNHVAFIEPVSIMPDTHAGSGSVIGFTMPLGEKVIPNVVGVDIGCGMLSVNIGKISKNKDYLLKLDEKIRNVIPMGNKIHSVEFVNDYFEKEFPFDEVTELSRNFIMKYNKKFGTSYNYVKYTYNWFLDKQRQINMNQNAELGIGSLGGGNHFIEIGEDNNGEMWLTIHTGSRNFGKMVCDYHQKIAKYELKYKREKILKEKIKEIRKNFKGNNIKIEVQKAKKDLGIDFDFNINGMEFLDGQLAIDYFMDMIFAQKYAQFNRHRIIELIVDELHFDVKDKIESIHNYINFEDMIIRKGAISSYIGERMIIPFSMADGLVICEGKSNKEWNYSAPHGAGRLMSRGEASRKVDINDFKRRMIGIVSTSVKKSTLDESPQAYKNHEIIEKLIEPTVNILNRVKPILNIKDNGESMSWKERREKIKKEKERRKLRYNKMKKL